MRVFLSINQIKQVALEYGRKKGATELADELGVSKQRIQQITVALRKKGVNIPKMRTQKGKYEEISVELRKEHPELFEQ